VVAGGIKNFGWSQCQFFFAEMSKTAYAQAAIDVCHNVSKTFIADLKTIKVKEFPTQERIKELKKQLWWEKDPFDQLQELLGGLVVGTHVVAPPDDAGSMIAATIIKKPGMFLYAVADSKEIQLELGKVGDCHNNISNLGKAKKIDLAFCGYALSSDGLWRFHSWGVANGKVVETTEKRLIYVGVCIHL